MSKSIAIAVICGLAALVTADRTALAQAGSTGGTIGKTDKSVSSGGQQERVTRPKQSDPAAIQQSGPKCGNAAGAWDMGHAVYKLAGSGTATASDGGSGVWRCEGGTVVIHWTGGWAAGHVDRMTISDDGQHTSGTGNGWPMSGARK